MSKKTFGIIAILGWFIASLPSCGGNEGVELQGEGIFTLISNHNVDFAPLERNSFFAYENEVGNLFKVYDFKYYISGVKLQKEGGGVYEVPMVNDGSQGYFLIDDADPESKLIILRDVPVGNYTGVSFTVGVNASQVDIENAIGALSPSKGMFNEATGEYLSLSLEGMSYESPEPEQAMGIRTGGANLFEAFISFGGQTAIIVDEKETIVEFTADLSQLFSAPALIDFAETPILFDTDQTRASASQFANAFSFDHVHNNP